MQVCHEGNGPARRKSTFTACPHNRTDAENTAGYFEINVNRLGFHMRYRILGRILIICTVLSSTMVTSGCSYAVGFSIKNNSDRDVNVRYTLRNLELGFEPELLGKSDSNEPLYIKFPADRSKIDIENRFIELKLFAGEEVRLFKMFDRSEFEYRKAFPLTELQLFSKFGNSVMMGREEVLTHFKPIESGFFSFGPKIIGYELIYR